MNLLEGKKALLTGGSSGIGARTAIMLAERGADVAITYVGDSQPAAEVQEKITALGRQCLTFESDVTDFNLAEKMVSSTAAEFGGLNLLVCCAGISDADMVWKMDEEQWDRVIDVNLKGTFNYMRAVTPIFKEQESGKIVAISSINGIRGKIGLANYSASKAGILGLTKSVAREMARYRVNVNAVAPGYIETAMTENLPEKIKEEATNQIVLGRLGKPEDVAKLVLFLLSDQSDYITGQVIQVDGGQLI